MRNINFMMAEVSLLLYQQLNISYISFQKVTAEIKPTEFVPRNGAVFRSKISSIFLLDDQGGNVH